MAFLRAQDSRVARLISYKAASEVAGKAAVLALLVLAARELSTADFGLLSVATTLGWMASVASDFGLQLYLGRAITRTSHPEAVLWPLLVTRLRAAGTALLLIGTISWSLAPTGAWIAFVLVAAAPLITSVAEFLNYAYRGLERTRIRIVDCATPWRPGVGRRGPVGLAHVADGRPGAHRECPRRPGGFARGRAAHRERPPRP